MFPCGAIGGAHHAHRRDGQKRRPSGGGGGGAAGQAIRGQGWQGVLLSDAHVAHAGVLSSYLDVFVARVLVPWQLIVFQGLSGTGKGTTTAKLQVRSDLRCEAS